MTVYRITSDNNIIRVSSRNQTIKIINNGRGPQGPTGPQGLPGDPATNLVTSVNGKQGIVVLNAADVGADASGSAAAALTTANTYTDTEIAAIDFPVDSVNGQTNAVVLNTDDISDTATNRYTNDTDITRLASTSGTNTGDQDLSPYATNSSLTSGLATKENLITAGTASQYWRGDKTWQPTLSLPISTATQTALDGKANFPDTDSHVPVRDGSGAQSSLRYTSGTTGYTIGFRTADGQIGVGAPTDNTHATNKGYVDTGLATKQDIISVSQFSVPYRNAVGTGQINSSLAVVQGSAVADSIARRTATGAIFTATATDNAHAATKAQMDTADALKVNKAGDAINSPTTLSPSTSSTYALQVGNAGTGAVHIGSSAAMGAIQVFASRPLQLNPAGNPVYINGAAIQTGTGFPNGVVSAPVGSIYIDTAVTNGASSWIKKSGTGNTGWQVLEGNTGWRDIAGVLINNWTATPTNLLMRRINNTIEIISSVQGLNPTGRKSPDFLTLQNGFRPVAQDGVFRILGVGNVSGSDTMVRAAYRSDFQTLFMPTAASAVVSFTLSWSTNDDWPTTLPGVSA